MGSALVRVCVVSTRGRNLVAYSESVDHHPDVRIAYGEVTFELTRYDLGGKDTYKPRRRDTSRKHQRIH